MTGSDHMPMRNRFTRFFLTIVVVQNISLRMTDMTTGSDVTEGYVTLKGLPWKDARNIRLSGVFSPEMTSSNVTHRASPGTGSHVTGSALVVLSRTSASYNIIIFYELLAFQWLSASFPPFYFHGAPSTKKLYEFSRLAPQQQDGSETIFTWNESSKLG
jgi:hypothetical protein